MPLEDRARFALSYKVKEEKHLRIYMGVEGRYLNENIPARPRLMDYVKKLKLRFSVGDLDLLERRKRFTSSLKGERDHMYVCVRVAQILRVGLT